MCDTATVKITSNTTIKHNNPDSKRLASFDPTLFPQKRTVKFSDTDSPKKSDLLEGMRLLELEANCVGMGGGGKSGSST